MAVDFYFAATSTGLYSTYQLAGKDLPVTMADEQSIILGTDRAGDRDGR